MKERPRRKITVTSSLNGRLLARYLKTTWTVFSQPQIFASWGSSLKRIIEKRVHIFHGRNHSMNYAMEIFLVYAVGSILYMALSTV